MPQHLKVGSITIRVGDRVKSLKFSNDITMCPEGTEAEVVVIKKMGGSPSIGVCADKELPGWHDCEGVTPPNRGLWLNPSTFKDCFMVLNQHLVINQPFSFKQQQLRGKRGRLLAPVQGGMSLIELEENVGGGGGDGMGKAGHCVLVPSKVLAWKEIKSKEA